MGLFRATLVCIALCLLLIGWGGQGYAVEKAVPKEDKTPPKVEKAVETTYRTVTLRGLNKVTARSNEMESPVGTLTRFGNLEIIPMTCWKSSPEDQPENAAFMEIWEIRTGESPERIFNGWMFSSTPALSALEHPFYDIAVVSCNQKVEGEKTAKSETGSVVKQENTKTERAPEEEPDQSEPPPLD